MSWKGQSQRHRRARKLGRAGGRYAQPPKRFKTRSILNNYKKGENVYVKGDSDVGIPSYEGKVVSSTKDYVVIKDKEDGYIDEVHKDMVDKDTNDAGMEEQIYRGDEYISDVDDKSNLKTELAQFTGTEQYYEGYMGVKETDGVHFLGAKAGWLVSDASVIVKIHKKVKNEDFVVVKTKVKKDKSGSVTYEDGNENKLYTQKYKYMDLPVGEYNMYYTNGVMMLTNEY